MRLSTVLELLLIFLLIAFAAYGRVIDRDEVNLVRLARSTGGRAKKQQLGVSMLSLKQATENINRHCVCTDIICNCCREVNLPLGLVGSGTGCVSLQYREKNKLAIQLSFRDRILASTEIANKNSRDLCVPLLSSYSSLCGKIYSIDKDDNHFKACLGLQLKTNSKVEASNRFSCFRFGPDGVQLRPAEDWPEDNEVKRPDEDDDDYDFFSDFVEDDDDEADSPPKSPTNSEDDDEDDDDDFLSEFDIFDSDEESDKKKVTTKPPLLSYTIPMIKPADSIIDNQNTLTSAPATPSNSKKPAKVNKVTTTITTTTSSTTIAADSVNEKVSTDDNLKDDSTKSPSKSPDESTKEEDSDVSVTELLSTLAESVTESILSETTVAIDNERNKTLKAEESNNIKYFIKPDKSTIKKIMVGVRPSTSINDLNSDSNIIKPIRPDPIENSTPQKVHDDKNEEDEEDDDEDVDLISYEEEDDDDDDDDVDDDTDGDDEDDTDKNNTENDDEDEKEDDEEKEDDQIESNKKPIANQDDEEENLAAQLFDDDKDDDDDDDDDEDDVVLSLLGGNNTDKNKTKKGNSGKIGVNEKPGKRKPIEEEDEDEDYDLSLLSKSQKRGRQSKVMRL